MIYMVELRDEVEIPDRGIVYVGVSKQEGCSKHVGLEPETNEPLNH